MIDIQLFGPLSVRASGARLGPRDFGGVKPKQLLEILLLARGRPVTKDRLADLLWGEALPRNVAATLETYVSVLRRHLGRATGGTGDLVLTEPGAYRFDTSRCRLDVDRFDALYHRVAAGGPEARPMLRGALAVVGGELLADEPYAAWAQEPRESYRERHAELLIRAAREALAERDLGAALAHARQATTVSPLSEDAWRTAMLALYALSRRTSALQAFERCQAILSDELYVDPSTETLALHAAILREEDPDRLLPPPRRSRRGAAGGSDRLGDRPLYGRAMELDQITGLVDEALAGAFTFVLVEGEAGIGKTRLLREVVAGLRAAGRPVRLGATRGNVLERRLPGVFLAEALRHALSDVEYLEEVLQAAAERRGPAGWVALERLASLVSGVAPLVLVLDDIHHADSVSLSAIAFLRRRCRTAPIAVLAAARPEEATGNHPLRRIDPDARFRLDVLGSDDVRDVSPVLLAKTGGHPQLLAECQAAGGYDPVAGWPAAVTGLVLARCQELGPRAHRLLLTASVFTRPFGPDDLADVLDASPVDLVEELEELCVRRILRVADARFTFRYEAVREILFESMSPARRLLLGRLTDPARQDVRFVTASADRLRPVAGRPSRS